MLFFHESLGMRCPWKTLVLERYVLMRTSEIRHFPRSKFERLASQGQCNLSIQVHYLCMKEVFSWRWISVWKLFASHMEHFRACNAECCVTALFYPISVNIALLYSTRGACYFCTLYVHNSYPAKGTFCFEWTVSFSVVNFYCSPLKRSVIHESVRWRIMHKVCGLASKRWLLSRLLSLCVWKMLNNDATSYNSLSNLA